MNLGSTIMDLIPICGGSVKTLRASPYLAKFDKIAIDAALMGLRASGDIKLVLGVLIKTANAAAPEYRRYCKRQSLQVETHEHLGASILRTDLSGVSLSTQALRHPLQVLEAVRSVQQVGG